ncbi:MAG: Succinate dehydrogenase cytochrome b subunit [Olavius algarvensis Delta 4 endosymbiont]|nr:MAG: Succinate dehydrogenase cytochrome b subunit [Olavius algarvensis Delta 4 endosymbiont]
MDWVIRTLGTAVGKKLLMAVTGLSFCGFLGAHLAGNLTLYGGADAFNSYAAHLHSLGPLLTVAELGLLALFVVHVVTGLVLFLQNLKARPQRYAVDRSAGGRTLGSRTMPYTGALIFLFIIYHLMNFHFVDKSHATIFAIVAGTFANPVQMALYITAMVVVAVHVSHGFWSLFQTLGANHPKYMPAIKILGLLFALVVGVGFGFIPIYVGML